MLDTIIIKIRGKESGFYDIVVTVVGSGGSGYCMVMVE